MVLTLRNNRELHCIWALIFFDEIQGALRKQAETKIAKALPQDPRAPDSQDVSGSRMFSMCLFVFFPATDHLFRTSVLSSQQPERATVKIAKM